MVDIIPPKNDKWLHFKIWPLKRANFFITKCAISGIKVTGTTALYHNLEMESEELGEDELSLNVLGRQFGGKLKESSSDQ